jgi:aminopeptidase N
LYPANEALALRLDGRHRIESLQVDGASLRATVAQGWQRIDLPPAARERRIDIRWTIRAAAPDAAASHRDTLTASEPQIGEAGSFLPAGGAWYPLPFDAAGPALHRFRLEVDLPASQRALASGDRVSDTVSNGRRIVRFDMATDSEGADLMAGPWVEATRTVKSRDGRRLTLATLFHPSIADQAEGYLDAAATHLARFESALGDYPYSRFTIASSPTPTGFGMAGLTYLGIDVLRLPFIRHTSLPHEILHNWWGNGVYLSNEGGNWSEGLTTFMADYALREAQGEDAARAPCGWTGCAACRRCRRRRTTVWPASAGARTMRRRPSGITRRRWCSSCCATCWARRHSIARCAPSGSNTAIGVPAGPICALHSKRRRGGRSTASF